jgi:hypothetical protein
MLLGVALALSLNAAAFGQEELVRFQKQLEQIQRDTRTMITPDLPIDQRAFIDGGGYLSEYFFAIDDFNGRTHVLRQTDLNLYGRVNIDGVHQFFVRGHVAYQDFDKNDSFNGKGDQTVGPFLERAIYRFDLARYYGAYEGETIDYNLTLDAGRQLIHWANGLVLSQDIDGGVVTGTWGKFSLQAIGGRTDPHQVDIDSSRPAFDNHTKRDFFGAMATYDLTVDHHPFVYGLVQQDRNGDEVGANGGRFDYNTYYVGFGSTGSLFDNVVYGLEAAYEGGSGLSSADFGVPQTEEDVSAFAADARVDYLFNDEHNSRLSAEVVIATGDNDRLFSTNNTVGGNKPGTTDNAFNGFGLINTGLAFAPTVSNLAMLRVGASTYPIRDTDWFHKLQVGVDLFFYNELTPSAPGSQPERRGSNAWLGFEADFYANWQITSDLSVALRYGVFMPDSGTLASDSDFRHFFFSGLTLAF